MKCPNRLNHLVRDLLVALVLAFLALYCIPRANAVELDALIGFGQGSTVRGYYRPYTWTPLTVYITGSSTAGRAQVQVRLLSKGYESLYTREIDLPDGTANATAGFNLDLSNRDLAFAGNGPTGVEVTVYQSGQKRASRIFALSRAIDSRAYTVLALTRDGSGLNVLSKKKLHLNHRQMSGSDAISAMTANAQRNRGTTELETPLQLLYSDTRGLPLGEQGYAAIDAIVLGDQPLDGLTEDQVEAIRGFVRSGGLLLVSGGGDLARLKSGLLAELLPLKPTSIKISNTIPILDRRYHTPLRSSTPFALTLGTLVPGAVSFLTQDGLPVVTARNYGLGRVVMTSFDFLDPAIRGWDGAPSLWRDLFRTRNTEATATALLQSNSTSEGYYGGEPQGIQRLVDALAGKKASATPNIWLVVGFVLAYILLLVPVNFFILRRMDRKEFAWATVPVLIVLFTFTSYVIGLSLKGGMLSAHRAVIVETSANSEQACGYGITSIYSPSRSDYDIALASVGGNRNHNATPFEITTNAVGDQKLTVEMGTSGVRLRGANIRLWDQRTFASPVSATIGQGIEAKVRMVSTTDAQVVLTNKTPYTLTSCSIVSSSGVITVGTLAPGQTSSPYRFVWPSPSPSTAVLASDPFTLGGYDPASVVGQGIRDLPTRDLIGKAMSAILANGQTNVQQFAGNMNSDDNSVLGLRPVVLVGWISGAMMDVQVNGKSAPSGDEAAMLVVHLPTPDNILDQSHLYRAKYMETVNPFLGNPLLKLESNDNGKNNL